MMIRFMSSFYLRQPCPSPARLAAHSGGRYQRSEADWRRNAQLVGLRLRVVDLEPGICIPPLGEGAVARRPSLALHLLTSPSRHAGATRTRLRFEPWRLLPRRGVRSR